MKKEIKIKLPAVYPLDFETYQLLLPKNHEVIADGMVLRFKNYEDLEDLAAQITTTYTETDNEISRNNL